MTSGKQDHSQTLADLLSGGAHARSSRLGVVAVAVLGATLIVLLLQALPLLRLPGSSAQPEAPRALDPQKAAEKFDQSITSYLAQFEGRSPFYLPLKNPKIEEPVEDVRPVATRYAGPRIVAMINNAVWFANGERVEVGKTDSRGEIKVLSINAPWSAKLRWQGGEFTVDFFQRSPLLTGNMEAWRSISIDEPARPLTPNAPASAPAPKRESPAQAAAPDAPAPQPAPIVVEVPVVEPPHEDPPPRPPPPHPQSPAEPVHSADPEPAPAPANPSTEPEKIKS